MDYSPLLHIAMPTGRRPVDWFVMLSSYNGYFDAAGGKDHGFIVVAGWMSTLDRWESFEWKWNEFLIHYDLPYFHMKEFAQSRGPFASWKGDEQKREDCLRVAADIIGSHVDFGVACIVEFSVFESVNRRYRLSETMGVPYSLAASTCVGIANSHIRSQRGGLLREVTYMFEDGDKGKGELLAIMERDGHPLPDFRPSRDQLNRRGELQKGVVQLQGADFASYELRKVHKDDPYEQWPISKYRKSLAALLRINCEWGRWSESDLITMCEKRRIGRRRTS